MTSFITPNPGIHTFPKLDSTQFTIQDFEQLVAWGQQLLYGIANWIVLALDNISVLGIHPFVQLQAFGQQVATAVAQLEALINGIGGTVIADVVDAIKLAQRGLDAVESQLLSNLGAFGVAFTDNLDGTVQLIDGAVDRLDGTAIQAATSGISDAQRALHALEDAAANAFGSANTATTEFGAAVNNHLQALLSAFTGGALAGGSTLSAQVAAAAASLQSTLQTNAQFLTGLFGPLAPFVTVTGSTVTVDVPGAVRALVATLVSAINANASGAAALATAIENLFGAVFPNLQSDIAAAQSEINTVAANINAVIDQANGVLANVKQALYNAQLPGVANTITTLSHI